MKSFYKVKLPFNLFVDIKTLNAVAVPLYVNINKFHGFVYIAFLIFGFTFYTKDSFWFRISEPENEDENE